MSWRPNRVNGPDDDDTSNNRKHKAAIVFLPVPQELKDKGVNAVTYARTFISIDYKGKIFNFTAYKEDITKTQAIYEKELDHEQITFDIKKEVNPTICDDVKNVLNYRQIINGLDLVIADPPYDKSDFVKYDCKPFNKAQVIRDLGEIMKPGSFLVWLDTRIPMYSKKVWNLIGYIAVIVSTNHRVRCLCLYQRTSN